MDKAQLGAGNVAITLAGKSETLRPSLSAAQAVSRLCGGFVPTVEALTKFDLDVLTSVVALGLGKQADEIAEAVWTTGAAALSPAAIKFVTNIANGGRPPVKGDKGGLGEGNPQAE